MTYPVPVTGWWGLLAPAQGKNWSKLVRELHLELLGNWTPNEGLLPGPGHD